ncbi:MAG: hypothetical protein AB7U20_11560 [Planctomycetaceae bacterium]
MAIRSSLSGEAIRLLRIIALAAAVAPTGANCQQSFPARVPRAGSTGFSQYHVSSSVARVARFAAKPLESGPSLVAPDGLVATDAVNVRQQIDVPIAVPDAGYWIVSSRKLPQELPWCGSQPLEVFQRLPDGALVSTDVPSLTSQIAPGVPVCIFIHGTFVSAELHQRESAKTYNWVRQSAPYLPLHVIFYTWPSDTDNTWKSPLLVNLRGEWAENNAFYLARLIAQLPQECPVCLVGHSHGARAVASTLHLLGGGQIGGYTFPYDAGAARRYRAVLAAAALDRHWLNPGERYERALCRAEGIVNLRNPGDLALHVYPLRRPFSRKAIGETGFTLWDRARLGSLNPKAIDLDVSPFMGLGHTWPYFYSEPRIAAAIVPYTYFVDPVDQRIGNRE